MADFYQAIPIVLKNEGGYDNDPADPGGETNFGISKASYPNVDIRNLTAAEAAAIYLRDFWMFSGIIDQSVGNKLFDSYVLMKHGAIKIAQQIAGAAADGSYGPNTESAINRMQSQTFLIAFRAGLAQHYRGIVAANPAEVKFLQGWLSRAAQ
jgi:lysozyme family protein